MQFEDLEVWKESMDLKESVYKTFANCKDYSFKDQIQRASVSIPSNIAEGFDRQTNKEFIQFLFIARGSCSELRTQLMFANRLGFIEEKTSEPYIEITRKLSAMLFNLIKTRKERFN
ncbi:MAG: four helix bundle protein [Bacteroidetes bacterium HGW-Bacteroidetes-4]|jgi:four helix bundle protein|nr:MAG: four helix bundle protein [Bacteroidetes bacterium HGW-Bacteroidetes-4]